jgi:hypothetical protein
MRFIWADTTENENNPLLSNSRDLGPQASGMTLDRQSSSTIRYSNGKVVDPMEISFSKSDNDGGKCLK